MKFMKGNQVVVAVIGLMFIAAGYLNFTNRANTNQMIETGALTDAIDMAEIGDAQLVSSKPANDSNLTEENNTIKNAEEDKNTSNQEKERKENENKQDNNKEVKQEENTIVQTNGTAANDEYFIKSRLERDTMYSQMIESYQKILDKTTISESQKQVAQKEIVKVNEQKNAIMITENLIKTKGIEDLVIFINDKSINIIIKAKELKAEQIAQVQNIVTRELKAKISDIHITNK